MTLIVFSTKSMSFQSTLPRGERRLQISCHTTNHYFNPRSREGSDPGLENDRRYALKISIHAPARGATVLEDRDAGYIKISIHAPARGATSFAYFLAFFFVISIHAPARGATSLSRRFRPQDFHFNPRSREGSDTVNKPFACLKKISIHAPARGATAFTSRLRSCHDISIHAPARGATFSFLRYKCNYSKFQSTLPRGERLGR